MTGDADVEGLDRPLGFTEALCARWYDAIPRGLQVVAAALCTRPVEREDLVVAVEGIRTRHRAAASRIAEGADGRLRYVPAEPATVTVAVAPAGARWRDRYAAQLTVPLDLSRALWRVELVPSPADAAVPAVVLVAGGHTLLDGISATTVVRELLHEPDDIAITAGPRLPAMEDLLPDSAPPAAPGLSPESDRWPVARPAPSASRTYGFADRTVDHETTSRLQTRAHAEQTTIGALLGVACTRARTVVPGASDSLGFNVPYDVRPRVSPPLPAGCVGAYFGRAHLYTSGPSCDREPWSAARDLSAQLHAELAAMARPPAWNDGAIRALLADLCRDDRASFDLGVMLTDLGVCELGPSVSAFFVTTVQTTGVEALVVSAASPAGGELCLGIGWPRPLIGNDTARAYADELVAQIARLAHA